MGQYRSSTVENRISRLRKYGMLPQDTSLFSEEQKYMYDEILFGSIDDIDYFIREHLNLANVETKQHFIHKKIREKKNERKNNGIYINIDPKDIVINEYCPFFNTKLDYNRSPNRGTSFRDVNLFSIDRIDNSKGYVKGNVMLMSRLANTMKRDATIDELKTFCKNAILLHIKRHES